MWTPNRAQWIAIGAGFFPVAILVLSATSAFLSGDRQLLWPAAMLLAAVIGLVTALTVSWLEARR